MSEPTLCLIPVPLAYDEGASRFPLRESLSIVIAHAAERGEWIAARSIQATLQAQGIAGPIQPQRLCRRTDNTIVLGVRARDDAVFPTVPATINAPDQPYIDGGTDNNEGYTLTIEEDSIALWGDSPVGLARGAQTLCQVLAQAHDGVPTLRIADAPAFRWRGVMLDVSRGKVPTLETLRRVVDVISAFKLNMLQLYVEHTFAFRSHPTIGREWGALTPEEIVDLDAYCRDRYVQLAPCLQSFGHLRRILELPDYAHLAESEARWSLAPVREESYGLLDDLYGDHLACFSSLYLNVCSDETYDLGTGQSQAVAAREGPGRLFLGHMQRLHALAAAHGRTMMIWDDMFLHYPELLAEAPRDAILLNWWYEAMEHYPQVDTVHATGMRQIVCPGTSSWGTLFPRLDNARANIRAMAADGRRVGALGVLTTDWGDNGHPNLLGNSWYGYAYGAAESWSPGRTDDATFERGFSRLFFGAHESANALEALRALSAACLLPGLQQMNGSRTLAMFFGHPLVPPPLDLTPEQLAFRGAMLRVHGIQAPHQSIEELEEEYKRPVPSETLARMRALAASALDHMSRLHGIDAEAALTLDEMRLAARQIGHAAVMAQLGRRITDVPQEGDRATLAAELSLVKRDAHDMRREYERLWLTRNKPQGLWLTLDQFDATAAVLDEWGAQVLPRYGWGQ